MKFENEIELLEALSLMHPNSKRNTLRKMRFCLSKRNPKMAQKGKNRGAERDSKILSRARSRCFKGAQDPIGQDRLKNQVYLIRFGHTKALLFKKK